jgi:hypothetical protein
VPNFSLYFPSSLDLRLHKLPPLKQFYFKKQEYQEALHAHAYAQHSLVRIGVCIFSDVLDGPGTI